MVEYCDTRHIERGEKQGIQSIPKEGDHIMSTRHKKLVILGIDHPHYSSIISAAQERKDIKLTAIAQETPPYADEVAVKYGAKSYRSYKECLECESPDIVGIAIYNGARGPWVAEVLNRGIPVIVDKPLCITISDINRIKRAFKNTKAPLCMMLTCRCNPLYVAIKEVIRKNEIGDIIAVEGTRYYPLNRANRPSWMFNSDSYGGPAIDILIHDYDLARWITKIKWDNITIKQLRTGLYKDADFKDIALLVGNDNNHLLTAKMSWHSPGKHFHHFAVYGTKGCVEIPIGARKPILTNKKGESKEITLPPAQPFVEQFFRALLEKDIAFPITAKEGIKVTYNIIKAKAR